MNWKLFLISSLLLAAMVGCNTQNSPKATVRVAVAASSAEVLKEIALVYEKKYHNKIEIISGSSGKLATQIEQGAPFDLFLAADSSFIHSLFNKKAIADQGRQFTSNRLAVWSKTPIDSLSSTLKNATKISIANPQIAPFGFAALAVLEKLEIETASLIYGSSISQVNQYIANQSVDVAFTSSSSKNQLLRKGFNVGYWLVVDQELMQHITPLNKHQQTTDFYQFLFSEEVNQIFINHGFNQ